MSAYHYNGKNNGKRWGIVLLVIAFCGLTGCSFLQNGSEKEKQDVVVQENQADSQDTEKTEQEAGEEIAPTSIAYTDWKIKESPVEGADNVYELNLEELNIDSGWIVAMEPYGEKVLLLKLSEQGEHRLYLVNPLTVSVDAMVTLPGGTFNQNDLTIDNEAYIRVCNAENGEIYIYNERLEEESRIKLPTKMAGHMVLTQDRKTVYYTDYGQTGFYCYHVDTEEVESLFVDIDISSGNGDMIGLLAEETCLAFNYYDNSQEQLLYEIRNIDNGKTVYKGTGAVMDIAVSDNDYMFVYEDKGVYEYIYGEDWTKTPKVLALKDYTEYDGSREICLRQKTLISGVCTQNVTEEYKEVTGNALQEEMSVSKLSFSQYDLESGMRSYAMDFYYVQEENAYVSGGNAVYLPKADCVLCSIDASTPRWLVWDLTKESSLSKDSNNYLYDWQDPAHPDEAGLSALRERAGRIGEENGVEIYIGDDISSCPSDIYRYEVSNNIIKIEKVLAVLEKALAKYPKGMLAQLGKGENSCLKIYLADDILPTDEMAIDSSIGIQNTMDGITFLVLDINSFRDLENTIYHEIFHAVELYLNMDENAFFDYEVWNQFNPEDFDYDYDYHVNEENIDWKYVAGNVDADAYFIDLYSKSFPNEDRARIMEYAMMDDTDSRKSNIDYEGIRAKLGYISEQIRKGFDTTGWPEVTVWEETLQKQ